MVDGVRSNEDMSLRADRLLPLRKVRTDFEFLQTEQAGKCHYFLSNRVLRALPCPVTWTGSRRDCLVQNSGQAHELAIAKGIAGNAKMVDSSHSEGRFVDVVIFIRVIGISLKSSEMEIGRQDQLLHLPFP
jgi:hypothetical protein